MSENIFWFTAKKQRNPPSNERDPRETEDARKALKGGPKWRSCRRDRPPNGKAHGMPWCDDANALEQIHQSKSPVQKKKVRERNERNDWILTDQRETIIIDDNMLGKRQQRMRGDEEPICTAQMIVERKGEEKRVETRVGLRCRGVVEMDGSVIAAKGEEERIARELRDDAGMDEGEATRENHRRVVLQMHVIVERGLHRCCGCHQEGSVHAQARPPLHPSHRIARATG